MKLFGNLDRERRGNGVHEDIWPAVAVTAACGFLSLFQPLYTHVDNYYVSLITNGIYDSDNYCLFLNPVLCKVIGMIRKVLPGADAFTLLSRILILAGIWLLASQISRSGRNRWEKAAGYLILFLFVVNASLFYENYTIWAAFFSFVAMVRLLFVMRRGGRAGDLVIGALFLSCGLMWRKQAAALFLPFYVLELGIGYLRARKEKRGMDYIRKCGRVFGISIACVVLLLFTDLSFRFSEKYAYGVAYNQIFSNMVDFPMKDYEEVKHVLPGVSRNDYESLQVRLLADTDHVVSQYGAVIKDVGRTYAGSFNMSGLKESNLFLLKTIAESPKTCLFCGILLFFLIWFLLSDVKWYHKLEFLLAYAGAYIILFYFAFIGRIPLRVINSVIYAVMGIVMLFFLTEQWKEYYHVLRWGKRIFFVLLFAIVMIDTVTYDFVRPQSVFHVEKDVEETPWESTYKEETLYLWQTNEFVQYPVRSFMNQGKLLPEEFLEHNLCYGEWIYGQVYYQNYMEELGVRNPMRALLGRDETYYVAEDNDLVLIWLQEHYDEGIQVRATGEVNQIPVWEFDGAGKEDDKVL